MPGTELRQKADLYRRMASVPTEGGHNEDRVLLSVADQLEREAAKLEAAKARRLPRVLRSGA
jgi:hypothetical protein